MPLSVAAVNLMLDYFRGLTLYVSVHNGSPGSTGANEIAGTTRQSITFGTAAAGVIAQANTPSVPGIPSGETVTHLGIWKHLSSTATADWLGYQDVTDFTGTGSPWAYDVAASTIDLANLALA
jgi:hypothetical protein